MAKSRLTKPSNQPRAKQSSLSRSEKPATISYKITNIKSMNPRKARGSRSKIRSF